jgi:hypothetical protein
VTSYIPDDDLAEWDAAYVLGALSLEDRRTYESYLAAHPARAVELTELAGMPGILNALSRDEAVALTDLAGAAPAEPRPDNVASLAHEAAKRRRRSRRTWLAAAVASAAALLIAGGVVGATVFPRSPAPVQAVALQPMQPTPRGGLTAQLAVTEKKWGTELNWEGLVEERQQLRHRGDHSRRCADRGRFVEAGGRRGDGTVGGHEHPDLPDPQRRHPRDRKRRATGDHDSAIAAHDAEIDKLQRKFE